jgi:hypothetical protein
MFRRIIWLLAAAMLALLAAAPATADTPLRLRTPARSFTYPAGDPCPFPLSLNVLEDNTFATLFFDKDGNFLREQDSGHLAVEYANALTGESIVLNTSGPARITASDGLLTVTLRGLSFVHLAGFAEVPTGIPVPSALHTQGPVVLEASFDLSTETLTQVPENWFNICEALAG